MLSFITANNLWMEISRTYTTKETTFRFQAARYWVSPYREWATFDFCFFFSTRANTSRLMSGGAIPASRYRSSTLDGFRQPVIAQYAVLSSESNPVPERHEISPRLVLHIQRRNNIKQSLCF